MRTDTHEKVLEKLATSDKVTIVIERLTDGKMRATSSSWDGEKVILCDRRSKSALLTGACTSRASRAITTSGPADRALRPVWPQARA
jgi:hypothetical protein